MMQIVSSSWQDVLEAQGLSDFDSLWSAQLQRVDDSNTARGGWSEVSLLPLPEVVDGAQALYIKRQQDFTCRMWPNMLARKPTLWREFINLKWCIEHEVPAALPLAYGEVNQEGHVRAILVTAGLTDYFPLSDGSKIIDWSDDERRQLLGDIAKVVFHMHSQGLQHNCLYPKHIYVHNDYQQGNRKIRLIDLEKARPLWLSRQGVFRDLDSLNRRAEGWSNEERRHFFESYYAWDDGKKQRLLDKLISSYNRWHHSDD
jgi:hypothetical protein